MFLGWSPGHMTRAVDGLLELGSRDGATVDLGPWIVCTPGARASRTALAMLVDAAHARGEALTPPTFVTPGELPATLLGIRGPMVSGITRRLAWTRALTRLGSEALGALIPHPPGSDEPGAWAAHARWIEGVCDRLWAEGRGVRESVELAASVLDEAQRTRWSALTTRGRHVRACARRDGRARRAARSPAPAQWRRPTP